MPGIVERILRSSEELERRTAEEVAKRADIKLQVFCHSKRSVHKNLVFSLTAWKSGGRLHGGGDENMLFCWRQPTARDVRPWDTVTLAKDKPRGCKGLIPGGLVSGDVVVCPSCLAKHTPSEIGDSILYSVPVEVAADILAEWWVRAGGRADLVLKYAPFDIRSRTMEKDARDLQRSRESRSTVVYPLANILVDTSTGSSLAARFKAFLLW